MNLNISESTLKNIVHDVIRESINEWYHSDKVDLSNYVLVGEVDFSTSLDSNKSYVFVNPTPKVWYDGTTEYDIIYCANKDGSGNQSTSIPHRYYKQIKIYPEHQNDELGEIFLGKKKSSDEIKVLHEKFVKKLFIVNNYVILHHNSNYKITGNYVKKGKPNSYSNNTDIGISFWGSKNNGNDPSNLSDYSYYCPIKLEDLYDLDTNPERLTLDKALNEYKYVGQSWKYGGDAIVVSTLVPTKIWRIHELYGDKWYNSKWEEVSKPF